MAFDSNPQAVFHGLGFAEPEEIGRATFEFASPYTVNQFADAGTGEVLLSDLEGNGLIMARVNGGTPSGMGLFIPEMIPVTAGSEPDSTDAVASTNSIALYHGAVTVHLGVDEDGKVLAASSSQALASTTIIFYKIK